MPVMYRTQEQMDALPKRHAYDLYVTPDEVATNAVRDLIRGVVYKGLQERSLSEEVHVVDPGAGYGAWGRAFKNIYPKHNIVMHGVEIQPEIPADPAYDRWDNADFLITTPETANTVDYVVGNPPYSLAEEFVRKGLEILKPGGQLLYLMRVEFLHSQGRANGLFREYPPSFIYVCSRRISFQTNGKTAHQEYVVMDWRKSDYISSPVLRWWDYQKGIIS